VPFARLEGSGTVEARPRRDGAAVGDRVAWSSVPNSYAEAVVAPVERLVRVPAGICDDVAAAAMLQGMTAHYLCRSTYVVKRGDTALVHAAAGGVGLLLVQMLREIGATVIGPRAAEKTGRARDAGADESCSTTGRVPGRREAPDGRSRRRVCTTGSGRRPPRKPRCLAPLGMMVFGNASGPVDPVDPLLSRKGSLF
jgi:NADPH2:quinone reductase